MAARALLGCHVTAGPVVLRLTEVEAYAGLADPASHAYRGRTPRNAVMFGPAGYLYVYFTYGMHWCMNVVCGPEGTPTAVLLRAGEVIDGVDVARQRRGLSVPARDLARGPARLTMALGVDKAAHGSYLLDGSGPVLLTRRHSAIASRSARSSPVPGSGLPSARTLPGASGCAATRPSARTGGTPRAIAVSFRGVPVRSRRPG